jgi:hypothetical protein
VTLKDFWGGGEPVEGEVTIAPSFTRKGKEEIDLFLKEIESALPHPQEFSPQLAEFERWYRNGCFQAWQAFGADFSRGSKKLQSRRHGGRSPRRCHGRGRIAFPSWMAKGSNLWRRRKSSVLAPGVLHPIGEGQESGGAAKRRGKPIDKIGKRSWRRRN